jgi:hypothetical protein
LRISEATISVVDFIMLQEFSLDAISLALVGGEEMVVNEILTDLADEMQGASPEGEIAERAVLVAAKIAHLLEEGRFSSINQGTAFFALGKAIHLTGSPELPELIIRLGSGISDPMTARQALIALENQLDMGISPTDEVAQKLIQLITGNLQIWGEDCSLTGRLIDQLDQR